MTIERVGNRWICHSTFAEKDIPKAAGFRWDPTNRQWWTPDAEKAAKLSGPDAAAKILAEHAAKQALRAELVEDSRQADADVVIPVPEGLAYLPYQRAGIASMRKRPRVLLGDEMGLGKTIQVIGLLNIEPAIRKVLIVCPATLKHNWYRELTKWLVSGRDLRIGIADSSHFRPDAYDISIINYDVLAKHIERLRSVTWDLLVCDEAHLLKNPKAKRTRAIVGIDDYTARKEECQPLAPVPCTRAAFLTGTPIPNRPVEAWPLVHFLAPDEFRSFYGYAKRYCSAGDGGYGFDASGASNLPELQTKLRASIMIRRLKADVLTELPAKRRQVVEIPANGASGAVAAEAEAFAAHEERLEQLKLAVELAKASDDPEDYRAAVDALRKGASAAFTEISKLRHDTAVAKIPYVIDHIRNVVEAGSKVVVFAHHHDVIQAIADEFAEEAASLYGETKMQDRQRAVDRFQTDPECLVFVGGILAAGVGITLTAASHVVFAELDWVPGNVTQAEDRLHRIGQRDMVLVQHLVLEGSLDARMASILVEKQEVQAAALDTVSQAATVSDASAQGPVVPTAGRAATESATRQAIAEAAAKLTPEEIAAIHGKLRILAALDADHAAVLNGVGFSRIDGEIGHSLAGAGTLTPKQAALGARLVHKYRRQLGAE